MNFGGSIPSVGATQIPDGAYLLDVREQDEWDAGHAPEAVHIPMSALNERAAEIPQDRDIYVVCRVGGRSAQVTVALNNAGWTALNVDGGMLAWASANLPIESTTTQADPYIA
ncbi:rhodanese-like domain-containing protein [Actinocorallia sp. A-T 12471]|uniref:rhodanese-like domain-containing protein n=1 Tax=Actinocorallia sp. A-T 12471 TaxID=3089813 RepID=UPI0029CE4DF4|nr:rhodanese-like domain-containing protein [Actinocorallia sp. A-T 12471]MDX6742084.1 rhodanese-like domain-containing protein [Actinocorallia sp. A-T 12471]